jgi:glycosyltransferase involved in cell wall biosynthesis
LRSGGGTRLKILEALAMARPVVTTSIGAEGLVLQPGIELALADDPVTFSNEVIRLLLDPDAAIRLGAAGREAVVRQYDWDRIGETIRTQLERRFAAPGGR